MKNNIFNIIQIGDKSNRISRAFDIFITITIFSNIIVTFLQTFDELAFMGGFFKWVEYITLFIFCVEYDAQPDIFRNAFSGIWWSMSTLLTVGYGDIYPVTTLGRIMAICIAYLGVGAVAIPTGIISAGFVEQYQRKSSISDIKNADIKEIAEIKIDKTQAGKTVEEIEETDFVSIYLIFRDDLSILPQKDTMLKLNDIIIIRDGN